jgi:protein TonB
MKLPEGMPRSALISALFHGSILAAFLLAWPKESPVSADAGMAGSVAVMFVTAGGAASASAASLPAAPPSESQRAYPDAAPPAPLVEDPIPEPAPAVAEAVEEVADFAVEPAEPPPPLDATELAEIPETAPMAAELELEALPEPPPPVEDALEAETVVEKPVVEEKSVADEKPAVEEQQVAQKPKPLPATKPTPPRDIETAAKPTSPPPQPAQTQLAARPTAATDTGPSMSASSDASTEPPAAPGAGATSSDDAGSTDIASLDTAADAGMPTGAGSVPGPSAAELQDYASLLAAWLDRHKEYPDRARRKHQEGIVLCEFAIDRQGQVLNYRIIQGSGYKLLDEEASEMMTRANPVPPPPAGMDQTYVVPIVFALN